MEAFNFKCVQRKKVINLIRYTLILLAFVLFCVFYWNTSNLNVLYFSVLSILLQNILYGYLNFRKRMLFVFFQFTFFLFLMTKPIIAIFKGEDWTKTIYRDFSDNANISRMLFCMFISLFMIWIGAIIGEQIKAKRYMYKIKSNYSELLRKNMYYIALTVFLISSMFSLIQGFEKIRFVSSHSYLEYYTSFSTKLPYVIRLVASFARYSFCFYLASLPTKKQAFVPCCFYIALAIPNLIMGSRADICLNALLIFFYYLLRDSWQQETKWFGTVERILVLIGSPFIIAFLGIYIDIRAHRSVNFSTIPSTIVNFLNDQGISFPYMCAGMGNTEMLPSGTCYTFGSIIDYFKYGNIGRLLTGTQPLGDTNSLLRATEGNSYAHHMSYILLKGEYLNGRGIGSSYINEVYADFGYIGIVLISFLIGFLLIYFVRAASHGCWQCAILLLSFSGIIYIPRAEFISFFDFFTKIQFWFIILVCYCGVYLFGRKYIYKIC